MGTRTVKRHEGAVFRLYDDGNKIGTVKRMHINTPNRSYWRVILGETVTCFHKRETKTVETFIGVSLF